MSTPADELLQRHVRAFNSGDADALLADFTPDATWVTGDYTVPPGELRSFFAGALQSLRPQLHLARVVDGGDVVVAEMTETWSSGDRRRAAALVAVLDLTDGRISRAKIYREGSADA